MEKIKPCPLCRSEAVYDSYLPYDGYHRESLLYRIHCTHCGLRVETTNLEQIEEMVKRWNFCSDLTEPIDIDSLL